MKPIALVVMNGWLNVARGTMTTTTTTTMMITMIGSTTKI